MDRCALFVDAGYVLADGAMAVHGTRRRESVSWDYGGLLQYLASIARERSEFPLLRCYWYEATLEGRRTSDHDAVADLPGVKLRVAKMRPGRREGVEGEIHRDLATLARNKAISDALVISAEEDLAQVIEEVQELGVRVLMAHITVDGNWTVSRALRQECDDIVEVTSSHLRPYVELIAGAEPPRTDEADDGTLVALRPQPNGNGNGNGAYKQQAARAELPAIYAAPVAAEYQRAALTPQLAPPMTTQRPDEAAASAYREEPHADEAAPRQEPSTRDQSSRDLASRDLPSRDLASRDLASRDLPSRDLPARQDPPGRPDHPGRQEPAAQRQDVPARTDLYGSPPPARREERADGAAYTAGGARDRLPARGNGVSPGGAPSREGSPPAHPPFALPAAQQAPAPQPGGGQGGGFGMSRGGYGSPQPSGAPAYSAAPTFTASPRTSGPQPALSVPPGPQPAQPLPAAQGAQQPAAGGLGDAVQSAHAEGEDFGASVARDAPALWLEAVLARKPRMPSDLEARLLQGSALPIDFLLHDEVRHALRRGFWDALERTRR